MVISGAGVMLILRFLHNSLSNFIYNVYKTSVVNLKYYPLRQFAKISISLPALLISNDYLMIPDPSQKKK